MNRRILCMAVACVIVYPAFAANKLLENIPLKWSPTETLAEMGPVDVSGALLMTKVHFDTFVDTRQNPAVIAENREKVANIRPVTTSTNVASYVTEHLRDSMHAAGVNAVDGASDVSVGGEIREFFVTETSLYRGNLALLVTVRNGAGKEIWNGMIVGGAEHFGRSYKADNYNETVSDMVLRATYNLLANPGFHEALQTGK
jgi:hypothetical protein